MTTTPDPRAQLELQIEALANTATEVWPHVGAVLFYLRAAMARPEILDELRRIIHQLSRAQIEKIATRTKEHPQ